MVDGRKPLLENSRLGGGHCPLPSTILSQKPWDGKFWNPFDLRSKAGKLLQISSGQGK